MKSVLVILTVLASFSAGAIEADKWLGVDGNTEATVGDCEPCRQKQKEALVTQDYQADLATVDSIMNEGGQHGPPATTRGTK